jgi:nucleoside phosphorylase
LLSNQYPVKPGFQARLQNHRMKSCLQLKYQKSEFKILLVMSSPEELRPFLHKVRHRRVSFRGRKAWNFQGPGYTGLALLAGMGGTAPRDLTAQAVTATAPHVVLVAGFGGALTALPPPGGLLIASECWRWASISGPLTKINFSPPAPPPTLASLLQDQGLPAFTGALVTTPRVTPKGSLPDQIFFLPKPVLDLESAEVADAIRTYNLPFLAVRAITDGVGEEIKEFLADIINQHQGVPLSRLFPALCAAPHRVGYCLHLWRRSLLAGRNLAEALDLVLAFLARQSSSRISS